MFYVVGIEDINPSLQWQRTYVAVRRSIPHRTQHRGRAVHDEGFWWRQSAQSGPIGRLWDVSLTVNWTWTLHNSTIPQLRPKVKTSLSHYFIFQSMFLPSPQSVNFRALNAQIDVMSLLELSSHFVVPKKPICEDVHSVWNKKVATVTKTSYLTHNSINLAF